MSLTHLTVAQLVKGLRDFIEPEYLLISYINDRYSNPYEATWIHCLNSHPTSAIICNIILILFW